MVLYEQAEPHRDREDTYKWYDMASFSGCVSSLPTEAEEVMILAAILVLKSSFVLPNSGDQKGIWGRAS